MRIASVASAFPNYYYGQNEILAALQQQWATEIPKPELLKRLHGRMGVEGRYLALPLESYAGLKTWGQANSVWMEIAPELAQKSLCRALSRAGLGVGDLNAIFFNSITGIASPSLETRLINRMRLSPNLKRVPIFGLGCVAGAAGIARAADYVRAYPNHAAAVVCVELCSLTWQRDDLSTANLISSGLFGDGGVAAIVGGSEKVHHGPRVLATKSVFYPNTEDVMGWDISEKGFRIVLSREVPEMVHRHLKKDVDEFLGENALERSDIGTWIMHTGGPAVLEAMSEALELPEGALDASWCCLKKVGNLSSASVLLVLEDVIAHRRPEPGTLSVLAAMGPGFCSELVLLKW